MIGMTELHDVNYIVVHCTGTKPSGNTDARAIHRYHTQQQGYAMIGYHFLVKTDGTVETGRPLFLQGAHCRAAHMNSRSIGVCYVGGVDVSGVNADTRTEEQKEALRKLISELRQRYPNVKVIGHRDVEPNKSCPCFDAMREYNQ